MLPHGKILLVDDEPLLLEMFESVLSEEGYLVIVASSSYDALYHLERGYFDVLVCDVLLEELDGFQVLQFAKTKLPRLGGLLLTGTPSEIGEEKARKLGASYLAKPVGIELLLESIQKAYQQARTWHSPRNQQTLKRHAS